MIKNVQYKGYTASPSDYECTDGELDMSLNMVYEDGSLRPILKPKAILQLNSNERIIYVHKCGIYTNYIIFRDDIQKILWYTSGRNGRNTLEITGYRDNVIAVGNTLVFSTDLGMRYFLWKGENYLDLGIELPELNVSPYLDTQIMSALDIRDRFGVDFSTDNHVLGVKIDFEDDEKRASLVDKDNPAYKVELTSNEKTAISEKIFPILNTCSRAAKERGYFFEPFFVRFAYRMYDGSHVRHTAPVLLVPTTWGKPLMSINNSNGQLYFNPIYSLSTLYFDIAESNIENWKDIITHIDIFVTEPLIDYSEGADSLLRILKFNPFYFSDKIGYYREYISPMTMHNGQWESISSIINDINENGVDVKSQGTVKFTRVGTYLEGYKWRCVYHIKQLGLGNSDFIVLKPHSKYAIWCEDAFGNQVFPVDNDAIQTVFPGWKVYPVSDMLPSEDVVFRLNTDANAEKTEYVESARVTLVSNSINCDFYIETRRIDGLDYNNVLTEYNNFYKIKEIDLQKDIAIDAFNDEYVLNNLVARPALLDIGSGSDNMILSNIFSYNNRLNIVVDKLQLTHTCTSLKKQNPIKNDAASKEIIKKAYVEVYGNGQYAYVEIPADDLNLDDLLMFSYPNNNAQNLVLYTVEKGMLGSSYYRYKIKLYRHNYLNLSYTFNNFSSLFGDDSSSIIYEEEQLDGESDFIIPNNDTIEYGNIIRLSDVNNPFRFSEEFTVSLPVKEIYALSTAAKALSQGQFGQYPLYAFTSEGIWALELTSTGTYSARQPISRDVVINKESITQIDSSVLFATDRGIMLISGSQVICISDKINSMDLFALKELPKADKLMVMYNDTIDEINKIIVQDFPSIPDVVDPTIPPAGKSLPAENKSDISLDDVTLLPFNEFLANCRMIYDYAHQHIIVYNPKVRYAYVYSLKSQLWGMMYSKITHNVNSYPEALAMENSILVDFSKTGSDVAAAMIVTRPLDMEHTDVFKTVRDIFQRGNMKDAKAKQVLYGSNDLNNWFLVWSSDNMHMGGFGGSPWKYYRIVMIREFDKSESIYGFSVQYDTRLTNRLR